ncbi:MAG: hypothetical protein ABSD12_05000 [Paraburkholderia sp.]|jgi:hypothetical protein
MRAASEQSLRFLVEKWLAPGPSIPVRVTEFSRTRTGRRRYVRVETALAAGARGLFFFRHDDGCWCVFPPTVDSRNVANEAVSARLAMAGG